MRGDRVDDQVVLRVDFFNARRAGIAKAERTHGIMNHVTQMAHDPDKIGVVSRMRDCQVEIDRLVRRSLPVVRDLINALERLAQGIELCLGPVGCGERGGAGLDFNAQLMHVNDLGEIEQIVVRHLERPHRKIRADERTDAVTGLHQPGQLQARDRFAHNVAADAELRAELLLGGKPLAWREALVEDARSQLLRNFVWQVFGAPETVERRHHTGLARRGGA